jgi:hypothetical protein
MSYGFGLLRRAAGVLGMSHRRCIFLLSLVLTGALTSPTVALGATQGSSVPLVGQSTGVTTLVMTGSGPLPTASQFSGESSQLGSFTGTADLSFTPLGPPPIIPYTLSGTETLVAADGSELFGDVSGTGTNTGTGVVSSTNDVTITGGTGRFANATGSFTETYVWTLVSFVNQVFTVDTTTTINGSLNLGVPGA